MPRGIKFFLVGIILVMIWAPINSGLAQYINVGTYPVPMQPLPQQGTTTFPYKDPVSGATYNSDGTNPYYPVTYTGTQTVSTITYNLQKLSISDPRYGSDSITFKGQNYTVYSAVPQANTIDYAYKNISPSTPSPYYDPNALTGIDFTIPNKINGGNPTAVATTPTLSPYTHEWVYLTTPPSDPNSFYFIPNLPNSSPTSHDGLTANIYFVSDPYLNRTGYAPLGPTYHLTAYGWASNATFVNNPYVIKWLNSTGGQAIGETDITATPPFNYWKHSILGADQQISNIATQIMQGLQQNDTQYPFPSGTPSNYLNWLVTQNPDNTYKMNGVYMHVQPQPGFQRNLLRYYTAWGTADIYNQSSDLFVRSDGTIELPAVQVKDASGNWTWRYAPIVAQTWDGSQRFTLLNQTNSPVPSTYDDYPGFENYSLANVYLPGKAGVVTSYINYWVWDSQSTGTTPTAREMDMWLGLKGMSVYDVQVWDDANGTEPGGQGGKPYMFGATTTYNSTTNQWQYALRLQASNSFGVARVPSTDLQDKLYDASFYVNFNKGLGYQKAATISYQWQPWTISSTGSDNQAIWIASPPPLGAGVATLTYANLMGGQVAISANTPTWDATLRKLYWNGGGPIDPSQLSKYNSTLNGNIWGNYIIKGNSSDPNTQYLIVLNPSAYFTPGAGGIGALPATGVLERCRTTITMSILCKAATSPTTISSPQPRPCPCCRWTARLFRSIPPVPPAI